MILELVFWNCRRQQVWVLSALRQAPNCNSFFWCFSCCYQYNEWNWDLLCSALAVFFAMNIHCHCIVPQSSWINYISHMMAWWKGIACRRCIQTKALAWLRSVFCVDFLKGNMKNRSEDYWKLFWKPWRSLKHTKIKEHPHCPSITWMHYSLYYCPCPKIGTSDVFFCTSVGCKYEKWKWQQQKDIRKAIESLKHTKNTEGRLHFACPSNTWKHWCPCPKIGTCCALVIWVLC